MSSATVATAKFLEVDLSPGHSLICSIFPMARDLLPPGRESDSIGLGRQRRFLVN